MTSRLFEITREGLLHVIRHPARSLLTALTSAIAIAVTVNVISLSFGLEEDIRGDVNLFGLRTVDVGRLPVLVPGLQRPPLGPAEEQRIRDVLAGLDALVVPRRQAAATVRLPGVAGAEPTTARMQVVAAPPGYFKTLTVPLAHGRWLSADDPSGADGEGVCTLDLAAASKLFPDVEPHDAVGRTVTLDLLGSERRLRVVGVLSDPLRYREIFEARGRAR